jgi:hypothetical protein
MNDTSAAVAALVQARHAAMTPEERLRAASTLFETARTLVDASLPPELDAAARRLARARRIYGDELPTAALQAHAEWPFTHKRTNHGLDPR